jgi:hypothetical protein
MAKFVKLLVLKGLALGFRRSKSHDNSLKWTLVARFAADISLILIYLRDSRVPFAWGKASADAYVLRAFWLCSRVRDSLVLGLFDAR